MKSMIRITGMRFKRIRKVGFTVMLLAVMMAMLALFIVFYQLMIYNVNLYIRSNQSLFHVGELFAHVDYSLRDTCATAIEQHQILSVLFLNEIWPSVAAASPWLLTEQRRLNSNLVKALQSSAYMDYLSKSNQRRLSKMEKTTIELYTESALEDVETKFARQVQTLNVKIGDPTREAMRGSHESLRHLTIPADISFISINRDTRARYAAVIDTMKKIVPVMNDKEPPFSLPAGLDANGLRLAAADLLEVVVFYMGDVRQLMLKMMEYFEYKAVDDEPAEYNELFFNLAVAFAVVFLCFSAGLCLLAFYFNRRLLALMIQYQNLRPEEIQLHKEFTTKKLVTFQNHKLDEARMIEQYTMIETKWSIYKKEEYIAKHKDAILVGGNRSKRTKRLSRDFYFRTFKLILACMGLQIALMGSYLGSTKYIISRLDQNVVQLKFYFDFYFGSSAVSDHYMYHNMLANLGNYAKVDGKNVSEMILNMTLENNDPIVKMNTYLGNMRAQFDLLLGEEASKIAHKLLFNDTCSFIDKNRQTYDIDFRLCNEYLGVNRGFMRFISLQRDIMTLLQASLRNIGTPATSFPYFLSQSPVFEEGYLKFSMLHSVVFETAVSTMISLQEAYISVDLLRIKSLNTNILQATFISLLAVFALSAFFSTVAALTEDLAIACESMKNMWPEVIFQNKLILKVFKESFESQV